MVKAIWKYNLPARDGEIVQWMPTGSTIIHVASQGNDIMMWIEVVDRFSEPKKRSFRVYGTGHDIEEGQYVGTAHVGPFVWHVYEV